MAATKVKRVFRVIFVRCKKMGRMIIFLYGFLVTVSRSIDTFLYKIALDFPKREYFSSIFEIGCLSLIEIPFYTVRFIGENPT